MLLDWIQSLGLLQQDPRSNVLARFPLPIRKILIEHVSQYLSNQLQNQPNHHRHEVSAETSQEFLVLPDISGLSGTLGNNPKKAANSSHLDWQVFTSFEHVVWVMEVIGQGFLLPIEETTIISNCINIYTVWLLEPSKRPAPFERNRQVFFQAIFRHMSTIFQPRNSPESLRNNSNVLMRHCDFCKSVLKLWITAARSLASEFDEETWLVLLRVVLGTTDSLLKEPLISFPNMSEELVESLLWALFELWLRSENENVDMWDAFKTLWSRWIHRPQAITQWSSTSYALTLRIMRLLYGGDFGTDFMMLSINTNSVVLDLSPEFMTYSWHRILYLNDNVRLIPTSNLLYVVLGVGKIADLFLTAGYMSGSSYTQSKSGQMGSINGSLALKENVPDGNTILDMFGNLLFESALSLQPEADDARAEAFATLCRIFQSVQHHNKFKKEYLAKFYYCISWGIRNSPVALVSILLNGSNLFLSGLEGINILFGDFVYGLKQVLPKPSFKTKYQAEIIRFHSVKLLKELVCLPSRYPDVPVTILDSLMAVEESTIWKLIRSFYHLPASNSSATQHSNDEGKTMKDLRPYLLNLILESLCAETRAFFAKNLFNTLFVFVMQDFRKTPKLSGLLMKVVQEMIVIGSQWNFEILLSGLDFLRKLVYLGDLTLQHSQDVVSEMVVSLCIFVDNLLLKDQLQSDHLLMKMALTCITEWCLAGNWFSKDTSIHSYVFNIMCKACNFTSSFSNSIGVVGGSGSGSGSTIPFSRIVEEDNNSSFGAGITSNSGAGYFENNRLMALVGSSGTGSLPAARKPKKGLPANSNSSSTSTSGGTLLQQKWQPLSNSLFSGMLNNGGGSGGNAAAVSGSMDQFLINMDASLQQVAELCLRRLVHLLDNFRNVPYSPARVSTLWKEQDLLRAHLATKTASTPEGRIEAVKSFIQELGKPNDNGRRMAFYLINRRVLMGVYEEERQVTEPMGSVENSLTVIVTLRSMTGCDSWQMKMDLGRLPPSLSAKDNVASVGDSKNSAAVRSAFLWSVHENLQNQSGSSPFFYTALHRTRLSMQLNLVYNKGEGSATEDNNSSLTQSTISRISRVLDDDAFSAASIFPQNNYQSRPSMDASSKSVGGLPDLDVMQKNIKTLIGNEKSFIDSQVLETLGCGIDPNGSQKSVAAQPEAPADPKNHRIRIFMAQMGLMSLESRCKVVPVPLTETLFKELDELDTLPERLNISISVMHVSLPATSELTQRHKNLDELILRGFFSVSQPFMDFLPTLGWIVDVGSHVGYRGKLDPALCAASPYYSDPDIEVMFHVPCLMNYHHFTSTSVKGNTSQEESNISAGAATGVVNESEVKASESHLLTREKKLPSVDSLTLKPVGPQGGGIVGSRSMTSMAAIATAVNENVDEIAGSETRKRQLVNRHSFGEGCSLGDLQAALTGLTKMLRDDMMSILWISNPNHPGTIDIERVIKALGLSPQSQYLVICPFYCSHSGDREERPESVEAGGEGGVGGGGEKGLFEECLSSGLYWIQTWQQGGKGASTTTPNPTATANLNSVNIGKGVAGGKGDGGSGSGSGTNTKRNSINSSSTHPTANADDSFTFGGSSMVGGPLSEGMIIDGETLGPLVRITVIDACRTMISMKTPHLQYPGLVRKQYLDRMQSKYGPLNGNGNASSIIAPPPIASTFFQHLF